MVAALRSAVTASVGTLMSSMLQLPERSPSICRPEYLSATSPVYWSAAWTARTKPNGKTVNGKTDNRDPKEWNRGQDLDDDRIQFSRSPQGRACPHRRRLRKGEARAELR